MISQKVGGYHRNGWGDMTEICNFGIKIPLEKIYRMMDRLTSGRIKQIQDKCWNHIVNRRRLKELREEGKIEFRGSAKTGGFYIA